MCGIAGAIGRIDASLVDAVAAASRRQLHRGPDDDGMWQSQPAEPPGAVFGFRRLAIIDLSQDGHQPMVDPVTGNAIAFNGEIYNYRELRQELEGLGHTFRSQSDTEVILNAYGRWGEAAIERLCGMFGLAIWDQADRTVLLARDRVGIKPLFYTRVTGRDGSPALAFASELRSLLATDLVERKLHPQALASYLWNGFVVGADTMLDGVQQLAPGTTMRVDPRTAEGTIRRYWQLPGDDGAGRDGDAAVAVERLQHELRGAMRQHLISDVPLGVFLSGGVDSSAVAAMAAEQAGDDPGSIKTFNVSFDEVEYDESSYAQAVAEALGTDHTDVRLTQREFLDHLDTALAAIDQPTFDGINTFFVSRAVREAGMTVALAGTGGDEIFGGYRSFVDVPKSARIARAVRWLPRGLLQLAGKLVARQRLGRFGEVPPQTRWGKLGDVLCAGGGLLDAYQVAYALFTRDLHGQLLRGNDGDLRHGLPRDYARELEQSLRGRSPLHAVSTMEIANFLGERLMRDTDWAAMAVSLEVRVPLLDHRVLEAAAAVDPARRYQPLGKKMLLRELGLDKVPASVFERKKSGFVLPIEAWCREQLQGEVADVLGDRAACESVGLDHEVVGRLWRSFRDGAPGMYWSRVWTLFVLLRWCREHRVSI